MATTELFGIAGWISQMVIGGNGVPQDSQLLSLIAQRFYISEVPQTSQGSADPIPDPSSFPCVLASPLSGSDLTLGFSRRLKTTSDWSIEAVTISEGFGRASQIYGRVDTILLPQVTYPPTFQNLYILSCRRVRPMQRTEMIEGKRYNYFGGQYEIESQWI